MRPMTQAASGGFMCREYAVGKLAYPRQNANVRPIGKAASGGFMCREYAVAKLAYPRQNANVRPIGQAASGGFMCREYAVGKLAYPRQNANVRPIGQAASGGLWMDRKRKRCSAAYFPGADIRCSGSSSGGRNCYAIRFHTILPRNNILPGIHIVERWRRYRRFLLY